jgi:tetraacyldisaccharide 4'-kinase
MIQEVRGRVNCQAVDSRVSHFSLAGELLRRVDDGPTREISELFGKVVHAVAGISNPDRFFDQLRSHGIRLLRHPMPDHAQFLESDIRFDDDLDVIITEKDAVKCAKIAHERLWFLPVSLSFEEGEDLQWMNALLAKLQASASRETE